MKDSIAGMIVVIILTVSLMLLATAAIASVLQWSWNMVVPSVFSLKPLSYGQAFAGVFLIQILMSPFRKNKEG